MNDDRQETPGEWWSAPERTAHHAYYRPTTNVQGILLFALIAAPGVLAVAVAVVHARSGHGLQHRDAVLGAIGIGCVLLGVVQALRLARSAPPTSR